MILVDTHAHIHFADSYGDDLLQVLKNARDNGVSKIVTAGTDEATSQAALDLVERPGLAAENTGVGVYPTVGLHPHSADLEVVKKITELARQNRDKIVAIGECGLDYYRDNAPRQAQIKALEVQIGLAEELDLPLIFHVRDAFDDFFEVLSGHANICGVIHSFTGGPNEVELASQLGLYFGLNGIMTFTKDKNQLEAAKLIPADKLLLETDCPYLAPAPLRGKRNEPANITLIAKFLADLRGVTMAELAAITTGNAKSLFGI